MADKLRLLHIEDNSLDAEIIEAELRKEWPDCHYEVISSENELTAALAGEAFSVILSDYSLPGFSGMDALFIVQRQSPDTPFLFVTGTMGEELAIETLKNGAIDYILKERLTKLIPAIERALREVTADKERTDFHREMKRNLERLELMQEVVQYHAKSVQDLLDFALDKVIALTESRIGYIYHYHEGQEQFVLNTWSKDVMESCSVAESQTVYQLDKTGLWGEVVRQRRPILVNDYPESLELKKGYPQGHVPLSRFLSIPVFDDDRIVAVVGVANKTRPYDQTDELQLTLMMDGVWKIATRLKLEEQIIHAGHEWQNTFDSIADSISLIDVEQRIKRCNQATCRMLSREFAEILDKPCWQLFHGTSAPIHDCPMNRAMTSLHTETSTIQHNDRWLEVTVDPIVSEHGELTGAVHIVRDITDRKLSELKLLEALTQAQRFSSALDKVSAYIYMKDLQSRYIYGNHMTLEFFSCSENELSGKDDTCFFPPDTVKRIREMDARVLKGERTIEENRITTEQGQRIYLEIKSPIYADPENTTICGLLGISTDITAQKEAEETLREVQAQLMQNDKLATIGQLAAGVAHEINNPMGFVGSNMVTLGKYIEKYNRYIDQLEHEMRAGFAGVLPEQIEALRQSLKLDFVIRDITVLVDECNEGIERVKKIVQDLRTFSRSETDSTCLVDLHQCLDSTINIINSVIRYSADLKREYGELQKVRCNMQQISQVFMNLLINAVHAIQDNENEFGEITVRTWSEGDDAFISIIDNGCGISPENVNKIFDAFYTTKDVGKGTGLGLSISSEIIRKHGGEIRVTTEPGAGSAFTVRLPLDSSQQVEEGPL